MCLSDVRWWSVCCWKQQIDQNTTPTPPLALGPQLADPLSFILSHNCRIKQANTFGASHCRLWPHCDVSHRKIGSSSKDTLFLSCPNHLGRCIYHGMFMHQSPVRSHRVHRECTADWRQTAVPSKQWDLSLLFFPLLGRTNSRKHHWPEANEFPMQNNYMYNHHLTHKNRWIQPSHCSIYKNLSMSEKNLTQCWAADSDLYTHSSGWSSTQ